MIDFTLLPNINKNRWNCEYCGNSIDISWVIEEIVNECKDNREFYDALMGETDEFDFSDCGICYHSIWFYNDEVKELQEFVKSVIEI